MTAFPNYRVSDAINEFEKLLAQEDWRLADYKIQEIIDYAQSHPQKYKETLRFHFGFLYKRNPMFKNLAYQMSLFGIYGFVDPLKIKEKKELFKSNMAKLL